MPTSLVTVRLKPEEATPEKVERKLGLPRGTLDRTFGVIEIDPTENLYTVLVDESTAADLDGRKDVEGRFGNPRIAPFPDAQDPVREVGPGSTNSEPARASARGASSETTPARPKAKRRPPKSAEPGS